jgi:hypothetical protein
MFVSDTAAQSELIDAIDAAHERLGRAHRELLTLIARADSAEVWIERGARDTAHWLSIRYGQSAWKAHRWIEAASALEHLPRTADALACGELGIDKVVELSRFATPQTESDLLRWAKNVSCGAIRRRADLALDAKIQEERDAERARSLSWWYLEEGRRLGIQAELPAAQGAIVVRAIERAAEVVPAMPGEADPFHADARRADGLVALCSARLAADPDPDRATVVIHAQLTRLDRRAQPAPDGLIGSSEIEGGSQVHPETVRRLLCNGRVQTVVEDEAGHIVGLGRMTREPAPWMIRQIRHRDRECRFPGCGMRRFTEAHHIVWWRHGGRTDLTNLVLICSFHHKLVHELGWRIERDPDGDFRWYQPDGARFRAEPPRDANDRDRQLFDPG